MKKTFIKDIKERSQVEDTFLVTRKELGVSRSGAPYLNLKLMDSTGELDARVWDNAEELSKGFDKDDVVMVKGYAVSYQGGIQLNLSSISRVEEGGYSLRDYLPSSQRDPEEMMEELDRVISTIGDRHIRELLRTLFSKKDVRERFKNVPAAKTMHHPYIGGLLEHVLSLCRLADFIGGHYKELNRDLLIAGAILHDIGKIYELRYTRGFDYTDEGRLIGHITMGVELVDSTADSIAGFPEELRVHLKHMILSHHGQLEFGSPKRPKTLEALVLSFIDDMDAKVQSMSSLMAKETGTQWTAYNRFFERYIYRGRYTSEEEAPEEVETEPQAASSDQPRKELELFKGD